MGLFQVLVEVTSEPFPTWRPILAAHEDDGTATILESEPEGETWRFPSGARIVGSIIHEGSGLKFSKGSKSIELDNFVVDPGNSILTGTVGGKAGVPLLQLDGSKLQLTQPGGNVQLYGTIAKLTDTAAMALNSTFGVTAFKAGMPLGVVKLLASGHAVSG